jgi:hypothetical protein
MTPDTTETVETYETTKGSEKKHGLSAFDIGLWGIVEVEDTNTTPVAILREQAELLGKRCRLRVEADTRLSDDSFQHTLSVSVAGLTYEVVRVTHTYNSYPCTVWAGKNGWAVICWNADQMKEGLKRVFTMEQTRGMISQLILAAAV